MVFYFYILQFWPWQQWNWEEDDRLGQFEGRGTTHLGLGLGWVENWQTVSIGQSKDFPFDSLHDVITDRKSLSGEKEAFISLLVL